MKKIIIPAIFISSIFLLANWSKETSDVCGNRQHRINFYGTIVTIANQNEKQKIDNISIENLYKQIPTYLTPTTHTDKINPTKHTIKTNPKSILQQVRVDLSEINTIETKRVQGIPVIWKWITDRGKKIKREYIEVIAIYNDKTQQNYLVELNKRIFFNVTSPAGPRESKITFKGLKSLTISGYEDRDLEKKDQFYKRRTRPKKGLNHKYPKGQVTK